MLLVLSCDASEELPAGLMGEGREIVSLYERIDGYSGLRRFLNWCRYLSWQAALPCDQAEKNSSAFGYPEV